MSTFPLGPGGREPDCGNGVDRVSGEPSPSRPSIFRSVSSIPSRDSRRGSWVSRKRSISSVILGMVERRIFLLRLENHLEAEIEGFGRNAGNGALQKIALAFGDVQRAAAGGAQCEQKEIPEMIGQLPAEAPGVRCPCGAGPRRRPCTRERRPQGRLRPPDARSAGRPRPARPKPLRRSGPSPLKDRSCSTRALRIPHASVRLARKRRRSRLRRARPLRGWRCS